MERGKTRNTRAAKSGFWCRECLCPRSKIMLDLDEDVVNGKMLKQDIWLKCVEG